jgi:hypothetical protein
MWLEYIRYRFRLHRSHDLLELTQVAALKALRNSPRCQGWRVVPAADDPSHLVLEIEWDPGTELVPFRGSDEFTAIHSALASSARSLEEADYSVDSRLLRRVLGGPETLFRLAEDIVADVLMEPLIAWRFQSRDGSKRGRLGLWLLEVLGGPDLFSSSFPGSSTRDGPLATDRLDLEERERLLEIASDALPSAREDQRRCVVGNLRAHLPLHPPPRSLGSAAPMLGPGAEAAELGAADAPFDGSDGEPGAQRRAPDSEVRSAAPSESPGSAPAASEADQRVQTGVRPRVEEAIPEAQAVGLAWSPRLRPPSPSLRSRRSGRWPRWRDRPR